MGTSQTPTPNTQLFHDVFNASPIGIAVENLEGRPLFVNPALCSILGFSEEELLSKHCVDFSQPEEAEKDWALFQQLQAGSIDHYQLEKRYFRRDGSLVWGRLSISLMNSGQSPLVIAMVEDITDKKKAEEALRESETRFRYVADTAPVMIWMSGLDKLCTDFNKPWLDFTGRTIEQELGNGWAQGVHKDDIERCLETYTQSFDRREKFQMEYRLRRHDGEYRWICDIGVPRYRQEGLFAGYIGSCIDVTERRRAEELQRATNCTLEEQTATLRSQEELLGVFVKNVPAAVAMLDRDMRYLQVSERWRSDYLSGRTEILGRSHYELFPDMPHRWREIHRRALLGETLRAEEDRWDAHDGPHWARWEVRPWKTAEGGVGGILILAEDITRRKQMEESLSDLSRKLIESQEQERSRIGRELHDDVNQQLALLAVELERLKENPSEVSIRVQELQKQVTDISNSVQALSHDLHSSKLEYLGVVAGMRSWCKEFAGRQKLEIDFTSDAPSALPLEVGLSLFRVLQEALNNVIKHSGAKQVEVELRENSNEIHLVISDLGRGFDVEAALQGNGLGLTSMRERVRLVKGTMSIESKMMSGTTIHVRVPLWSAQERQRAAVG